MSADAVSWRKAAAYAPISCRAAGHMLECSLSDHYQVITGPYGVYVLKHSDSLAGHTLICIGNISYQVGYAIIRCLIINPSVRNEPLR